MSATDPRIDAYIKKSAPFAQPIMNHLRALVHKACPQAMETIKWGFLISNTKEFYAACPPSNNIAVLVFGKGH